MAWYMDSTRVFVSDWDEKESQIIPRLQPLNGGTTLQVFGYESPITTITALIVGDTDKEALRSMSESGNNYTLTGPEGSQGDFLVHSVAFKRLQCICQNIRPDLDEMAPVYTVSMELYPN